LKKHPGFYHFDPPVSVHELRSENCGRDDGGRFAQGNDCGLLRIGININDKDQEFTEQILRGQKTIETRRTNSLRPWVGHRVGIIRTGKGKAMLVGHAVIGKPKFYETKEHFDKDHSKHLVAEASKHYIGKEGKYGYPLTQVKRIEPTPVHTKGIVARVLVPLAKRSFSDCARTDDGKFASGNTCASGGGEGGDNSKSNSGKLRNSGGQQTRAARKLYQMGTSEKKVGEFVQALGGDPKASKVKMNWPNVNITVASKSGKSMFHVDFGYYKVRVYSLGIRLPSALVDHIKQAAMAAFPTRNEAKRKDVEFEVHADPNAYKDWTAENAQKQKDMKDKYKYTLYKAPNERQYRELVEFYESRAGGNCGNGAGGFQPGNTCASGKAVDAAKGAAIGALHGAAAVAGGLAPLPTLMAKGAAVGATIGAVKGLYDNAKRPTRVMDKIAEIGSSEKQVGSLVKDLGGHPSSVADVRRGGIHLTVRNPAGKKIFHVEMDQKNVTIYPRRTTGELTDRQIEMVKRAAKDAMPKNVQIAVKSSSRAYLVKLVKNGFRITANAFGSLMAGYVGFPLADLAEGELKYTIRKRLQNGSK